MKLFPTYVLYPKWNSTKSFLLFLLIIMITWGFAKCRRSEELVRIIEEIPTADSVSFIVLGDWGKNGSVSQMDVAKQMFKKGRNHNVQFVVTTGDNFYYSGVKDIYDAHWQSSYENVYPKDSLAVKWFPALGNHDYGLNPQAQVDYSSVSTRWNMPGRFYSIKRKINATDSVLFLFTDTSPFISPYYSSTEIMGDLKKQDTAAQMQWIHSTLNASKETWKIAVGHHPVYSVGKHGNSADLIQRFKPVLLKYNVDFYLAGHDHDLQYIKQPSENLKYLVSGAGSEARTVAPDSNTVFAKETLGFLIVTLYSEKAHIYFYDKDGVLLFTQQVDK
jgi:tartrate-resistant acid phosphatase type 5